MGKNIMFIKNEALITYLQKDLTFVTFSIYLPMIGLHPADYLFASCQRGHGALPKPQCEMLEHVRIGKSGVWELRVCHFVWIDCMGYVPPTSRRLYYFVDLLYLCARLITLMAMIKMTTSDMLMLMMIVGAEGNVDADNYR